MCEGVEEAVSVRQWAGRMAEQLATTVHGALLFMVDSSIQGIRAALTQEQFPQVEEAAAQHGYRPAVDSALLLLSLLSSHYLQRPDLYALLKEQLLSLPELLGLVGLEKARLLMLLAYNYESVYGGGGGEGTRFLSWAEGALEDEGSVAECSVMLFENCLRVGFGDAVWHSLTARLPTTRAPPVFRLLARILEEMLDSLPAERVEGVVRAVLERLVGEFGRSEAGKRGREVQGSPELFLCLDIITVIAKNEKYLREE